MSTKKNKKYFVDGSRLHDDGHEDHHLSSRRSFLRNLGLLTAGTALVPGLPLQALGSSSLSQALLDNPTDRILVLIRLKGGNDGLNTIIPTYAFSDYQNARPTVAYAQSQLQALSPELAISNDFSGAYDLWQRDSMRVVNGVGYPDASLSHFRGTDILASASDANEILTSGWLGRHLDNCFPDYLNNPPSAPPAIQIGGAGSISFTSDENISLSVTVNNVNELAELAETGELYDTTDLPDCLYGSQLGYLRSVANSAFVFAGGIEQAYDLGANSVAYTGGELSDQLALVARLIKGGLETRIFLVTLEGFDTHAEQGSNHPRLLQELGGSLKAFYDDLAVSGDDQRVVSTTFSEFGRRIEQNASGGTDHGTASPQLLFGPALNGNGIHGDAPDLSAPDNNGNLVFTTDFRSVYASLLENWLCVPAADVDSVLGGNFPRIDLGFDCQTVSTRNVVERLPVTLQRAPFGWQLAFESEGGEYTIQLVDTMGRVLSERKEYVSVGQAELPIRTPGQLVAGVYAYRLVSPKGREASGLIPMM
ncbi:MAG: DUF1501 domain-containing protein [Saprospiraceae bacterium]